MSAADVAHAIQVDVEQNITHLALVALQVLDLAGGGVVVLAVDGDDLDAQRAGIVV